MSLNSTHKFPAPVGGVPLPLDLGPAILFAVLHALPLPLAFYHLFKPRSRTTVILGTVGFAIERVVAYGLRAKATSDLSLRASESFETYLQTTLNAGLITMGQDLVVLLRALLVSTTFGTPLPDEATGSAGASADTPGSPERATELTVIDRKPPTHNSDDLRDEGKWQGNQKRADDQPRHRLWMRVLCGLTSLLFLVAVVLSIIPGIMYKSAIHSGQHADLVQQLRYASTGVAFGLLVWVACGISYAIVKLPRLPKGPAIYLLFISLLLAIVGLYRLIVMHSWTTSLLSTAPGSQNTPGEKATFWVFHAAPEWLAATLIVSADARKTFKTGPFGDKNSNQPAEMEKLKPCPWKKRAQS
ncbi:hypothetical protein BD414DRAFT_422306 [Trametes punicea]|nr:hypothetical protein BD414DRAFT_422306 [Trametes punicea]